MGGQFNFQETIIYFHTTVSPTHIQFQRASIFLLFLLSKPFTFNLLQCSLYPLRNFTNLVSLNYFNYRLPAFILFYAHYPSQSLFYHCLRMQPLFFPQILQKTQDFKSHQYQDYINFASDLIYKKHAATAADICFSFSWDRVAFLQCLVCCFVLVLGKIYTD